MSQDEDQALDAAYRRASEAEAGRPAAEVRARILAQAQVQAETRRRADAQAPVPAQADGQAEARRQLPVANQPRYWMRAVAGVAVLGVALLVLRQVDYQLPGTAPQTLEVTAMQESAGSAPAPQLTPVPAPAPPPAQEPASVPASPMIAESAGTAPVEDSAAPSAKAAPPPPAAAAPQGAEAPGAAVSAARAERFEAEVSSNRMAMDAQAPVRDTRTPAQLVQQHFPGQYASPRGHRLWLLREADGAVYRVGELAAGESLADLTRELEASLGGRSIQPWREESLRNASGQPITLAISQVAAR